MKMKFFRCQHCGNIVAMVEESGVPVVCCGENMKELVANTTDAANEKHVPVYEIKDGTVSVKVGEVTHPMLEEHHIQWIAVETVNGCQMKYLKAGEEPEACFAICEGDDITAFYEYCNLHGLWAAEV